MNSDDPWQGARTNLMSLLSGNKKIPSQQLKPQQLPKSIPEHDITNLESRIFANSKSISSRDLFKPKPQEPQIIEIIDQPESDGIIEIIDTTVPDKLIDESKMFNSAKRTSVKDLFKQFTPKYEATLRIDPEKLRSISPTPTKFVTVKVDPEKLKSIRKARTVSTLSTLSTLMNFKQPNKVRQVLPTKFITLKINPEKLKLIRRTTSLSSLMHSKQPKSHKLKPLPLPLLTKDQFHIQQQEEPYIARSISLQPRHTKDIPQQGSFTYPNNPPPDKPQHTYLPSSLDRITLANSKLNLKPPAIRVLYEKYILPGITPTHTDVPWVDFFKPERMKELLMHKTNITQISEWISQSFTQDLGNLLIIQGSHGSGKSTAVYTCMNELQGYVHEINTGMPRSRRDIYPTLKQLCTTHLVHDTTEFQRGLILLEDVNFVFDQDKTFWQSVNDILQISKRPIVLTCEELWNIPQAVVDTAEIVFLDDYVVEQRDILDYLWLCCLIHGFKVDDTVLTEILIENFNGIGYDLRQCLMQCEVLCKVNQSGLIDVKSVQAATPHQIEDINTMSRMLELNSCADVISSNSISLINHNIQENQFMDIYYIDESTKLTQPTLNFELNIGDDLQQQLRVNNSLPEHKFTFNDLRYECNRFIASRSKPRLKQLRNVPEPTGIPETSCLNSMSYTPYIVDLLPMARIWQSFQICLDHVEGLKEVSVKEFLNYRDFQYKSTLNSTIPHPDI
ncbi:Telomere length regulation protein ELG1 [Spathaspora sp. JA1]|nr:Telomere length regulation protein ELG1 [Spathaspora sp. JA1]